MPLCFDDACFCGQVTDFQLPEYKILGIFQYLRRSIVGVSFQLGTEKNLASGDSDRLEMNGREGLFASEWRCHTKRLTLGFT